MCVWAIALLICFSAMLQMESPVLAAKKTVRIQKIVWTHSEYRHKTLKKGEKYKIKAECLPEGSGRNIKYISRKPKVAAVSKKGVVKAKKNGKAVIEAKVKGTRKKALYYIHVGKKTKKIVWANAKSKKTLYTGKSFKMKVRVYPKKAAYRKAIYTSSNPSVAKVSSGGTVTPKKVGKTIITAKAADQSGKKIRCRIEVKESIKKIKITAKYKTCFISGKLKLKANIKPEEATETGVSWTSSDKDVATVSRKGVVTGVSTGYATITARAKDNSNKKARYVVSVRGELDPSECDFVAHRGLSSLYPENTIQSFAGAASQPFAAIETDVWENKHFYIDDLQSDPGLIIMHDKDISRVCGTNVDVSELNETNIWEYPIITGNGFKENEEYKIPLLEDYISVMKQTDKEATIEIKEENLSQEAIRKIVHMTDKEGISSNTSLTSFNKQSLINAREMLANRKDIKLSRAIGRRDKANIDGEIQWCIDNGINEVSMYYPYITPERIEKIKQNGMEIAAWTIDDKSKAADMIELGCDKIITNTILW